MNFRSGFVALVGRPNVGKSTLLNALLGEKVAIVSPKPQTTRTRIQGIVNRDDSQVILVDTPGLTDSKTALRKAMRRVTGLAAADADVTLVVAETRGDRAELAEADLDVLATAKRGSGKIVLALNKIDKLERKESLLPWMQRYTAEEKVAAVIPISAKTGDGLEVLYNALVELLPESPPLFPTDMHTDMAERTLCAELVREQLLFKLRDEVPHSTAVVIESFEDERNENPDGGQGPGLVRLEGRIIVERDSQKGIVVGKGGEMVKAVSTQARLEIEKLLGCKVFLRLTVHVDRDWTANPRSVQRLGLDPDVEAE